MSNNCRCKPVEFTYRNRTFDDPEHCISDKSHKIAVGEKAYFSVNGNQIVVCASCKMALEVCNNGNKKSSFDDSKIGVISEREKEVLRLMAEGKTGKEIAEKLGIECNTAQTHVKNIINKLGAKSRTEAVIRAINRKIIRCPEI